MFGLKSGVCQPASVLDPMQVLSCLRSSGQWQVQEKILRFDFKKLLRVHGHGQINRLARHFA
jgi:hypothetical protein